QRGVADLPAGTGGVIGGQMWLAGEILTGELDQRFDEAFRGVEIRRGALGPGGVGWLGDHEADRGAFLHALVTGNKDAAGFEETGDDISAGLIESQRVEQSADQRRTQMRLIFDKRVG